VAGILLLLSQQDSFQALSEQISDQILNLPAALIIMEPALRVQVLQAQTAAGMWVRNGLSFPNQFLLYADVKFRLEMMDKDIISLQIGAALMNRNPNEFLITLLEKFNLFEWTTLDNEQYLTDEAVNELVSEFLSLILNIFASRFTPGVGQVGKKECLVKEIVQLLCSQSMTRSELSNHLLEEDASDAKVEEVIGQVAELKGTVFELKREFFKEYDWHYVNYSKEEMSKAEGKQRERKIAEKEEHPELFPPPKLPAFSPAFGPVVNVLKADVLLKILVMVLERGGSAVENISGENQGHLRKVLHLIGHGLNEQEGKREAFQFVEACEKWGVWGRLDELLKKKGVEQHHEMIRWIKKKRCEIVPEETNGVGALVEVMEVERNSDGNLEEELKKKKAAEMRKKMMAQMAAARQKFMSKNADLFESSTVKGTEGSTDDGAGAADMEITEDLAAISMPTVVLGPNQSQPKQEEEMYAFYLKKT